MDSGDASCMAGCGAPGSGAGTADPVAPPELVNDSAMAEGTAPVTGDPMELRLPSPLAAAGPDAAGTTGSLSPAGAAPSGGMSTAATSSRTGALEPWMEVLTRPR